MLNQQILYFFLKFYWFSRQVDNRNLRIKKNSVELRFSQEFLTALNTWSGEGEV